MPEEVIVEKGKTDPKELLDKKFKQGDKIILVSQVMQTCIAEYVAEDKDRYLVKNPILFASFPERDKENPNVVRTRMQALCVWNRSVMADMNVDQYCAFPKASFGVMFVDDVTNNPMFSTDSTRIYNGTWGKVEVKPGA